MDTKFWEIAINTYYHGLKKKKMKKQYFSSSTALPSTGLVANFVSKTRGYVNFIPAFIGKVLRFFWGRNGPHFSSLINIRTKVEGLKRPRGFIFARIVDFW